MADYQPNMPFGWFMFWIMMNAVIAFAHLVVTLLVYSLGSSGQVHRRHREADESTHLLSRAEAGSNGLVKPAVVPKKINFRYLLSMLAFWVGMVFFALGYNFIRAAGPAFVSVGVAMIILGTLVGLNDILRSPTHKLLRNKRTPGEVLEYVQSMREIAPDIVFSVDSYHFERRSGNRNRQKVYTNRISIPFSYDFVEDVSGDIDVDLPWSMVKFEFIKTVDYVDEYSKTVYENARESIFTHSVHDEYADKEVRVAMRNYVEEFFCVFDNKRFASFFNLTVFYIFRILMLGYIFECFFEIVSCHCSFHLTKRIKVDPALEKQRQLAIAALTTATHPVQAVPLASQQQPLQQQRPLPPLPPQQQQQQQQQQYIQPTDDAPSYSAQYVPIDIMGASSSSSSSAAAASASVEASAPPLSEKY